MAEQWITALIVMLAIALGAFLDRVLPWFGGLRHQPEPKKQLEERAESLTKWLQSGKQQKVINDKLEVSNSHEQLLEWVQAAPPIYVPTMETLHAGERQRLTERFWLVFAFLITLGAVSGWYTVNAALSENPSSAVASVLAGLFGSCVAAFRSCLDRRANGFEDRFGNAAPDAKATKERFTDGMVTWFIGRPLLGAVVGIMTYCALRGEIFGKELSQDVFQGNPSRLVFYAWLTGLFAKTMLDLFLDRTKKIFGV